jgi:hypothetical protein
VSARLEGWGGRAPLMLRDAAPWRAEDARERAQGAAPQHEGSETSRCTSSAHSRA